MNDEQEQATDSAPIEDWVVCPKCLKEVPMHRAHYCVRVTITTPEYEVTPERLVELLHDARSKTKEANRRDFESSAKLATLTAEVESLRADKARLDWLDEVRADVLRPSEHDGDVEIGVDDHNECGEWNHYKRPRGTGDSIRAAIDAARADAARKEPPAKAHGCEVGE